VLPTFEARCWVGLQAGLRWKRLSVAPRCLSPLGAPLDAAGNMSSKTRHLAAGNFCRRDVFAWNSSVGHDRGMAIDRQVKTVVALSIRSLRASATSTH
jgi:hypothetical protein